MKVILLIIGISAIAMALQQTVMFGQLTLDKPFTDYYGPATVTFQYPNETIAIYQAFKVNYSYDKIDSLAWVLIANQTNYSYSMLCWHNTNHSITLYRFTCPKFCDSSIEFSMFVNYCELHIWHDDAFNGTMPGTLEFDMNVTIVYEGGPIRNPFDPPTPSPVPAESPPAAVDPKPLLGPWEITGIVLGCVAFAALIGVGVWLGRRWWIARGAARQ